MPCKQQKARALISTQYSVGKKLGEGSYAVVHEAKDLRDGAVYAMKIICKEKSKEKRLKSEVRGKCFSARRKPKLNVLVVASRESDCRVSGSEDRRFEESPRHWQRGEWGGPVRCRAGWTMFRV